MDLTVISTYRCNSRCQVCYISKNPTEPKEEITLETLSKLPGGFDNLNVSGGEPTLRRDLPELVDELYPKARIMEISSDGLYPERLVPMIKRYPDIKVRFSVEGIAATSNVIRGEEEGFRTKLKGVRMLREAGATDLGFAMVIQDKNTEQLLQLYELALSEGVELETSTLHDAWQRYEKDHDCYNRMKVAKEIEGLITAMLRTRKLKNWFRAYLNMGLLEKILGRYRLISCTAGRDFAIIDPWSDVWACKVRADLPLGNLARQDWSEILQSEQARVTLGKVHACRQNCWMVTTARTAMCSRWIPQLPKASPLAWVLWNKFKVSLGGEVDFSSYTGSDQVNDSTLVDCRSYLVGKVKGEIGR